MKSASSIISSGVTCSNVIFKAITLSSSSISKRQSGVQGVQGQATIDLQGTSATQLDNTELTTLINNGLTSSSSTLGINDISSTSKCFLY